MPLDIAQLSSQGCFKKRKKEKVKSYRKKRSLKREEFSDGSC